MESAVLQRQPNSKIIDIQNTPKIPDIGYYNNNSDIPDNAQNSYTKLKNNVTSSCNIKNSNGIYSNVIINDYLNNNFKNPFPTGYVNPFSDKKIDELNFPYFLYKTDFKNQINTITDKNGNSINITGNDYSIPNVISKTLKTDGGTNIISNQIQFLVCQLINARNRLYNSDEFGIFEKNESIKKIFDKFGQNLMIPLFIVFTMTIYFLISGIFSSLDICANIINCVQKSNNSDISIFYWIGIFSGILLPLLFLTINLRNTISHNLKEIENKNITNNPLGTEDKIPTDKKEFDYMTLSLFLLIIFGLIAVLFTIKKESFNNIIYTLLITIILLIISITIYILYSYIPFFNSSDPNKMNNTSPDLLKLFIDPLINNENNQDQTFIYSNHSFTTNITMTFIIIFVVIFIISIIFLKYCSTIKGKTGDNGFFKSLIKGFLGSSAILVLPALWVFNFILGVQYFYIYPIILIIARFVRYVIMTILYSNFKDSNSISSNLHKKFDNFKNYSPSWGLIGIEELKLIMGLFGFDNVFSDSILDGSSNNVNISNNKFVSSGLLSFVAEGNKKGIVLSILYFIISIIISVTVIFGIIKVHK